VDISYETLDKVPDNKGATIMIHAHQTAPTQFVGAKGIRFAYPAQQQAGR
jgi:hypothetical protein